MKTSRLRSWTAVVAAASLLGAGIAEAGSTSTAAADATTVKVTLSEFKTVLAPPSAAKGTVTFAVTNRGKLPHDFKIAGKKTAKLAPGKSAKLVVTFAKAGRYPFVCSISGHGAAGMKGAFTVR